MQLATDHCPLPLAERDPTLREIVWREFDLHLVSGDNTDEVFAHSSRDMRDHFVTAVDRDAEARIGESLRDDSFDF